MVESILEKLRLGEHVNRETLDRAGAIDNAIRHGLPINHKSLDEILKNVRQLDPLDNIELYSKIQSLFGNLRKYISDIHAPTTGVALNELDTTELDPFDYTDFNYNLYSIDEILDFSDTSMDEETIPFEMSRVVAREQNERLIESFVNFDNEIFLPNSPDVDRRVYSLDFNFDLDMSTYTSTVYFDEFYGRMYIDNGTGFYSPLDVIVNGTLNQELFFETEGLNSGEIEFQLSLGKSPLLIGDMVEPIIRSIMITYLREENKFHDSIGPDIMAYVNPLLGNLDPSQIASQFYEIVREDEMSAITLYDSAESINVTLDDVYTDMVNAFISDSFSLMDNDRNNEGSSSLITQLELDSIEERNRINYLTFSNIPSSEIRSKVFGNSMEFQMFRFDMFFDTSIYSMYYSMADNIALSPLSAPVMMQDSEFGSCSADLQTYFGMDHTSILDSRTTVSNLKEFYQRYTQKYSDLVEVHGGTSWVDIGQLYYRADGNVFDMFDILRRDSADLPNHIQLILNKLISLNLATKQGQVLLVKYLDHIKY